MGSGVPRNYLCRSFGELWTAQSFQGMEFVTSAFDAWSQSHPVNRLISVRHGNGTDPARSNGAEVRDDTDR
jgi:hypothetical protein